MADPGKLASALRGDWNMGAPKAQKVESPTMHVVSTIEDGRPSILGVHPARSGALAHADEVARTKWKADEPEYDQIPANDWAKIAQKHGVLAKSVDWQEAPQTWHERAPHEHAPSHWESDESKSPEEGNWGYGIRSTSGFQHHAGLHKELTNFDMRKPYPGYDKAMNYWNGREDYEGVPFVHSMGVIE